MSGIITTERANDTEFCLALLEGRTPPGVEPGSTEDIELRGAAAEAVAAGNAGPPMTPEQVVTVVTLLSRPQP